MGASDYPSKLREADLGRLNTEYRIPDSVDLILPGPEERACYPRPGCVAISEAILRAGLRLPIHPFFRLVLRSYGLAPTQLNPNSWSQMVGSWMLWKEASLGVEMPLSVFQSFYLPKVTARGIRPGDGITLLHGVPTLHSCSICRAPSKNGRAHGAGPLGDGT